MTKNLTNLPAWQALVAHQKRIANQSMQDWFAQDKLRFSQFSLRAGEIFLDYSKNRLTTETLGLLCDLAKATNLSKKIESLFSGESVNSSENRPALHTALRNQPSQPVLVKGVDIMPLINNNIKQMRLFTQKVRDGEWKGATGKPIKDIINVGIGGSHLGPLLTTTALADYAHDRLRCHFISNIDITHVYEVLNQIDPETSLFIISSKSFTTLETARNAQVVKTWLENKLPGKNIQAHFIAVTAALDKAQQFGIPSEQIFPLWDWVGGRYSIWSAIALPLALLIGMDGFVEFLQGANAMDEHFHHAEFSENIPVIMALLGIWYINFFAANNHAIIPYSHRLSHLRTYLQQADMESNGKSISHLGLPIDYLTGPIIWGEQGCNGQHAFHQLLHQGQHFTPVDFILVGKNQSDIDNNQDILVASGLSQAQALLYGKSYEQAFTELLADGYTEEMASVLAKHKSIPGNRPSNILFLNKLNPYSLGSLLALYEHKIFVQGAIWDINSFDQWGVELGKTLLSDILADLQNPNNPSKHDVSTQGLIAYYEKIRSEP